MGCFFAIEAGPRCGTREPLVPFNARRCRCGADGRGDVGLQVGWGVAFAHFNRLHVAPPLVISEDDLRSGLAVIDAALDVSDRLVGG